MSATTDEAARERAKEKRCKRNAELREEYLKLETLIANLEEKAQGRRESVEIRRARRKLRDTGNAFMQENEGLAYAVAAPFSSNSRSNAEDYAQSAKFGLWEAFTKWDPKRGTIGTFSRNFIRGSTQREVNATEFGGMSYSDFAARKKVLDLVEVLTEKTGTAPSHEEVAEAGEFTATLVERVRRPRGTSLDKPIGDEGATLSDIVGEANSVDQFDGIDGYHTWVEYLKEVTEDLNSLELWLLIRRDGLDGAPAQTLVEISNELDKGREILRRRELAARKRLTKPLPAPYV